MTAPSVAARTHLEIDPRWSGEVVALAPGVAEVELTASAAMRADEHGLVHGGFVFSLADYAAMLAVNEPHVVLGSAEVRFLRAVRVGARLVAKAARETQEGKKHRVRVEVACGAEVIFRGDFVCFVPPRHVLDEEPEVRS